MKRTLPSTVYKGRTLTPQAVELVVEGDRLDARQKRADRRIRVLIAVVAVFCVMATVALTAILARTDGLAETGEQIQQAASERDEKIRTLEQQVTALGGVPVVTVDSPPAVVTPAAPGRSDAEIMRIVLQVLAENPELLPRADAPQVDYDRIIAEVQARIPAPKDGVTPEVDYDRLVREAVALIPKPKDGVDGQSPPCLQTDSQCQGKDGETGSPGRGVVNRAYVTTDTGCVERFTYNQDPFTQDFAAPVEFCILNGG